MFFDNRVVLNRVLTRDTQAFQIISTFWVRDMSHILKSERIKQTLSLVNAIVNEDTQIVYR